MEFGEEVRETRYGKERVYRTIICSTCGSLFLKRISFIDADFNFCGKNCASQYNEAIRYMAPIGQKVCRKCKQTKPLIGHFYTRRKNPDGHTSTCKICINLDREKNKERALIYRQGRVAAYRHIGRRSHLMSKYGLTVDQYETLLKAQGGVCAICKKEETRIVKGTLANLCVDHCHETGKIRGLLCDRCNRGIEIFYDSVVHLKSAIYYLSKP